MLENMANQETDPPDFVLPLYHNKAAVYDPHAISNLSEWPNKPTLPAELNLALTNYFYELIGNKNFAPAHHVLHSLFYMTGVLSFNISFYNLARSSIDGIYRNEAMPLVTFGEGSKVKETDSASKDFIATKLQKALLHLTSGFMRPKLTTLVNRSIYSSERFAVLWRIRRPEAILSIEKIKLLEQEQDSIEVLTEAIFHRALSLGKSYGIIIDDHTAGHLQAYIQKEITRAYRDLGAVKRFFGNIKFNYFERSLTPYIQSLISTVCRMNGGDAHSTYHGVCQTASEPDVATMVNASIFWGVTKAFTKDAEELANKIPKQIRHFKIQCLDDSNHYKQFLKNDEPRAGIKHVAIMGRHVVMRTSAFNTLEFPAYLDIEKKLSDILLQEGYKVTYKAHPECDWRHFDQFFDPRVKIDWRPFEAVMHEFDALFYHFGASSTLPHALGSNLHIFMIQDGWHDIRIWSERIQKCLKLYCNMIPGKIDKNGLIIPNTEALLTAFKSPIEFNKESRVSDFFNRIEFD